tara:strand:+ start:994 stop:2931 length:1938 start_codon:yes stop_codon:yes gene_type:complete
MVRLSYRNVFIFAFDLVAAAVSLPLAALLRLGPVGFANYLPIITYMSFLFAAVSFFALLAARLHRVAWRFISVNDALLVAATSAMINLIFLALMFMMTRLDSVPRAIVPINIFVLTSMLIGSRLALRLWYERGVSKFAFTPDGKRTSIVLLLGATDTAEAFILTNFRDRQNLYRVVGALDSGHRPIGSLMRGVSVMGRITDLEKICNDLGKRDYRPDTLVIADQNIRGRELQGIVDFATKHSMRLSRLPDTNELHDEATTAVMRPIEIEDLLSRNEIVLDHLAMVRLVSQKRVLVTGAGGSIGSELVHQIAKFEPTHITLVELSEYNLYEIDRHLAGRFPDVPRTTLIADVRDRDSMRSIFEAQRPQLVFHTAALKHVPLLEAQPAQAVLTNILGTRNVADACLEFGVNRMIMVSTDKAAHPVSVMGATKRIAESYCQSLDLASSQVSDTRFITVRFGNVLGSAGSVVPLFQKQLAAGGPITVTHRDMTRYFMTPREAIQLILQAGTLNQGELERGHIVVLDMGEPVNIYEMATLMIKLAGLQPDRDIKIVFTGLRPGEKMTETLFQPDEEIVGTSFKDLHIASAKIGDYAFVSRIVEQLITAATHHDDQAVQDLLELSVTGFATRRAEMNDASAPVSTAQYSEI